jgi:hypothetical protein
MRRTRCRQVGFRDDEFQIVAHQGFAVSKTQLHGTQRPRFVQYPQPILGGELVVSTNERSRLRKWIE